jgi:hypothetical protein
VDIEEEVIMRDKISGGITLTKIISINVAAEEVHVEAESLESFMKTPTSAWRNRWKITSTSPLIISMANLKSSKKLHSSTNNLIH